MGFLLDDYPGADAAYSLRQLAGSQTNAIRVRRSSDNVEQDIGFVNGELDESALTTFVGAGDGFIATVYDQSGNGRDLINSVASGQPQIVMAGTVNKSNGRPSASTVGNRTLDYKSTATGPDRISMFITGVPTSGAAFSDVIALVSWQDQPSPANIFLLSAEYAVRVSGGFRLFNETAGGSQTQLSAFFTPASLPGTVSDITAYEDGTQLTVDNDNTNAGNLSFSDDSVFWGGYKDRSWFHDNDLQELVIYFSDETSNRTAIENHQDAYWISKTNDNDFGGGTAFVATVTDTAGVTDILNRAYTGQRTVTDQVDPTDVASAIATLSALIADTVGVTDVKDRIGTYFRELSDTEGVTDAIVSGLALQLLLQDTEGATDTIATDLQQIIGVLLQDTEGATDSLSSLQVITAQIADTVGATDFQQAIGTYLRSVADTEGLTDQATLVRVIAAQIADTVGITDALATQITGAVVAQISDTVGVSDNLDSATFAEVYFEVLRRTVIL